MQNKLHLLTIELLRVKNDKKNGAEVFFSSMLCKTNKRAVKRSILTVDSLEISYVEILEEHQFEGLPFVIIGRATTYILNSGNVNLISMLSFSLLFHSPLIILFFRFLMFFLTPEMHPTFPTILYTPHYCHLTV